MFKLTKYELMGTKNFMIGIILFLFGSSTAMQLLAKRRVNIGINQGLLVSENYEVLLLGVLSIMLIGGFIASIVYIISSFRKELYEDRGYLTFSLPITGAQLLGSKLIVSLLWVMVISIGVFLYNLILSTFLFPGIIDGFSQITAFLKQVEGIQNISIFLFFSSLGGSLISLLLIYLSITISKISLKGKTIGSLWVVLFLLLNTLYTYIFEKVAQLIPINLDVQTFKLISERELYLRGLKSPSIFHGMNMNFAGTIPLASIVYALLVLVGVFYLTGYLLDKKVELE